MTMTYTRRLLDGAKAVANEIEEDTAPRLALQTEMKKRIGKGREDLPKRRSIAVDTVMVIIRKTRDRRRMKESTIHPVRTLTTEDLMRR